MSIRAMAISVSRLSILLAIVLIPFLAIADTECEYMNPDYPSIALKLRSVNRWQFARINQFMSEEMSDHTVQLILDGKSKCFSVQQLDVVGELETLLAKLNSQRTINPANWNQFLELLAAISCTKIFEEGEEISCDELKPNMFIQAARDAAHKAKIYDPSYVKLNSHLGDVPESLGVCSDVVIRGLRKVDIDLQDLVNKDRRTHPERYRGLQPGPVNADRSIDHRRVTNLMEYFKADTNSFVTIHPPDRNWQPGDIVAWNLRGKDGFLAHIGVVSDENALNGEYLVIHHLPPSGREDNSLHDWEIIGHFRLKH